MSDATNDEPTPEELLALRRSCARALAWHGSRDAASYLDEIPRDTDPDTYGDGGVVAELEAEVARLLGKPAAVFMPSGTMAQQIALRVHADRTGRRTIVFHPCCHLDSHEERGYERLHGLHGVPVGERERVLTPADLDGIAEPPAALLLELPQRDLGGQLPDWDDLVAQAAWAHERGAALHMDGARLWGCEDFYARSMGEIAEPFDTVYVSFYKQLGGLPGACLAGPDDVVARARVWRRRHGGTLYGMWPNAASARNVLRIRLPRIEVYRRHALAIADALRGLEGVDVVPDPPQTTMMHLVFARPVEVLRRSAVRIAREEGIWTFGHFFDTGAPGTARAELETGDATTAFSPEELRSVVERLLDA
ncbi:MAG TPA: beta-eliminating lyase-related protein [Actinomycetota bacterium]